MTKKLLSTLVATLFAATPAFAQSDEDPLRIEGSGTFGGIYNRQNADDKAKLQEYQDLGNGALSNISARGRNSTNWFEGYGENFGRDDQYMFIRGGVYGVFKAGAYLNDMPHDFSTNAITPFAGVGNETLTTSFPRLDTSTWQSFNLGYERRDAGGYFEWQRNNPWYFRIDGNQVKFDGTKVGSGSNGTSPGNGYMTLPIPVQTSTVNFGAEGGYQTNKATYSLRWDYSKFDNALNTLYWNNPFFGGTLFDTTQLPPDNTFNKVTATANWRDLPWNSVIAARYTWARTTSNVGIQASQLNSGPAYATTMPSEGVFEGENVNQSFAASWTARPVANVDTRVYYYWTKLDNNSSDIEFGNSPTTPLPSGLSCGNVPPPVGSPPATAWPGGNCEDDKFDYRKNNVGFDVYWRFTRGQRLGFGWDYWDLDQQRVDYDKAHANTFFVEYKNTMFDTLTGRIKYRYVKRDATSNFSNDGLSPNDPNFLLPFTSAFDMQDLTTNGVRLYLDWTPAPLFAVSFQGDWAQNKYDNVTYGRTKNDVQGYYLSASWGDPNRLMIRGFGDWQQVKYPSNHRYIGTISGGPPPATNFPPGWCANSGSSTNLNCFDPNQQAYFSNSTTNPNSFTGSYNWSSQTKDETWMVGLGADWPFASQWLLNASYIYVSNEGEATFSSPCCDKNGNPFGNPLNIGNFDNTKQHYFNIKTTYAYSKSWSFTAGYAYEKYSRNDVGSDGFTYLTPSPTIVAPSTSLSYLNGYNLNPNGNQNIFWLTASYKFDAPPLPPPPVKVAEAPKPAPPPPPPPPPPPKPVQVQKITLDSKVLFDFDKAVLKPEGKAAIDSQVVGKLGQMQKVEIVIVTGHTDRLGSDAYNKKLSERRADAVRDYLVFKGIPKDKIETIGMGEKQAVVQCEQKNRKELIACLAPNRRVEVQVKGESAM